MLFQLFRGLGTIMVLLPSLDASLLSKALGQTARMPRPYFTSAPTRTNRLAPEASLGYQMNAIYDRVGQQTRLSLQTFHRVERTPDGAFASFSVSATYGGPGPSWQSDSVEFEFMTFSPTRRGWALGHLTTLRVTIADSVLTFPTHTYEKMRMRLGDRYRSERLTFRIAASDLASLAAASNVELKLGRFRFKIDGRGLDGIRAFSRRLRAGTP